MQVRSFKRIVIIYAVVSILSTLSLAMLTQRDSLLSEAYKVAVAKITEQGEGVVSYDSGYLASLLVTIDENESLIMVLLFLHLISASLILFIMLNIKLNEEALDNAT